MQDLVSLCFIFSRLLDATPRVRYISPKTGIIQARILHKILKEFSLPTLFSSLLSLLIKQVFWRHLMQTGDHDYTKVSVKIYIPLMDAFNKRLKSMFIKRDDFINHVIDIEIEHLSEELKGLKQSNVARKFISSSLDKKKDAKIVNIVIRKKTANKLKQICDETNVIRDAFFNRLLLLLIADEPLLAGKPLLKHLDLPEYITYESYERFLPPAVATVPLDAIKDFYEDPLIYIRLAVEERFNSGLYRLDMSSIFNADSKYLWFSCFLDDSEVPDTEAYKKAQEESEIILNDLFISSKNET